jgi:hypothetical protein
MVAKRSRYSIAMPGQEGGGGLLIARNRRPLLFMGAYQAKAALHVDVPGDGCGEWGRTAYGVHPRRRCGFPIVWTSDVSGDGPRKGYVPIANRACVHIHKARQPITIQSRQPSVGRRWNTS